MAYMRLELLQETFIMVVWCSPVVWLCMVPVLFMRIQYLQWVLVQYEYPLFLLLPPIVVDGCGILVGRLGSEMALSVLLVGWTKVSILVCLSVLGAWFEASRFGGVIYVGSASSSPGSFGTPALQSKFLRFLGRRKPQMSFLLWRFSVVWFLPSMSQLFRVMSGINWSCG